jgi:glycogen debranching enzyme
MHVVLRSRIPGDDLPDTDLVVAVDAGRLVCVCARNSWPRDARGGLSSGDFPALAIKEGLPAVSGSREAGRWRDDGAGDCRRTVARADGLTEDLLLPPHQTVEREIVIEVDDVEARPSPPEPPEAWRPRARLRTSDAPLRRALRRSAEDLDGLRMRDPLTGADVVAAGAPWFMTLFGRDSLLTSLMTVGWDPTLAVGTLTALAARQGQAHDDTTEEEPGRIMHETRLVGGAGLFHGGGSVYYGSTDSSPLFVVLLDELDRWGGHRDVVDDLLPAADAALAWCREHGDLDHDGLMESRRLSPTGLLNQGWKDSGDGVPDDEGRPVEPPYALVEVQGYWYAALRARARWPRTEATPPCGAAAAQAAMLREHIDACFWTTRAAPRSAVDAHKLVGSLASNAGHLLWTGACSPRRAGALAATMMHRRLRTAWGLRTLARDHPAYNPLGYHVGSIWPHDTALVAWGLARWGFGHGCTSLARGVIQTADRLDGRLPELIAGFSPHDEVADGVPVPYPTACSPQAWGRAPCCCCARRRLEVDAWVGSSSTRRRPTGPPWSSTAL